MFACHAGPPIVAVIPATTAQELWEAEHAGVAAATAGTPWRIYWNGPENEDDADRQIALIQHALSLHAAALILAPNHPVALSSPVKDVLDRAIPTVIIATDLREQDRPNLAFVLNDDEAAGRVAADYIGRALKGAGSVALIGDNPNNYSAMRRAAAFAHTLTLSHPGMHLIAHLRGGARSGQAEQQVEETLQRHPDLDAIVSIGIVETRVASIALGSRTDKRHILLVGFDQDLDLMYRVRHGGIDAMVAQDTFHMGKQAMEMILAAQRGTPMVPKTLVPPVLVTRETIDSPEVQRVLSMDWRQHAR